eukprot:66606-Lingulodinium_polyedra.AAC.1
MVLGSLGVCAAETRARRSAAVGGLEWRWAFVVCGPVAGRAPSWGPCCSGPLGWRVPLCCAGRVSNRYAASCARVWTAMSPRSSAEPVRTSSVLKRDAQPPARV